MQLKKVDLSAGGALAKQAKQLYIRSFPKEERLPWWVLRLSSRSSGIDLTAWLDGDVFCGFTSSVTVENMHFLLFLAVQEQGRGYGSAILTALKQTYETVTLNVEPLVPDAPNYAQRERRFAFYRRNGFYDTGFHVWEVGGMFRVLSTDPRLDIDTYKSVFKKLSRGIVNVRVEKAQE